MSERPEADGLFRLASVAMRRYSREPDSRAQAARMIVAAAICLLAEETSPGEAALATSETLAELAQRKRRSARAASEAPPVGVMK